MIQEEGILNYWGGALVTVSKTLLNKTTLSLSTQDFLGKIGLPIQDDIRPKFHVNPNFLETLEYKGSNYIVLGNELRIKVCLNEESDEVFAIDPQGEYPTVFINSNIRYLVVFLQLYESILPVLRAASDDEAHDLISELQQAFFQTDPKALSDPNNWWSVIIEEAYYNI